MFLGAISLFLPGVRLGGTIDTSSKLPRALEAVSNYRLLSYLYMQSCRHQSLNVAAPNDT